MRTNRNFVIAVMVIFLIVFGVWALTIKEGRDILNGDRDREEVVYEGNTEDRPHK
jgi:hypothetical protein